ncbi:YcnI family protein [Streptomyces sp. NPDC005385]|uniref:YcnI family protein n=1 Tax=Streptomyces sp. NPDC005385 TaxID=3157039 RepID=UPI0033AAED50
MSPTSTILRRTGTVAALTLAGVLAAAGAASAHVTVHPESYAKGATDGVLSFRVPNEEDTASTTKVQVFLPTDHPLLGVLVTPQAGWTAKVTTTRLKKPVKTDDGTITDAVSEITWTGGRIRHGEFQDFDVAFGQLPDDTGRLSFKTLQTYSDGNVVRWIEEAKAGADEPENPAPALRLTAEGAGGEAAEGSGGAAGSDADQAAPSSASSSKDSEESTASDKASDSTARSLGTAGLVVGVLGLIAAGFTIARGRNARP